ncbi:MAG: helix-turn-helix domain-containing protein [Rhodovibrionaceae bacterium]
MHLSRPPKAVLRPFVQTLWASDGADGAVQAARELVLPTGALHLVLRLEELPLRVFSGLADTSGTRIGCAVVGGARAAPYLRDVARPVASVGALLRPGVSGLLLAAPAAAFSQQHTELAAVWGESPVAELRERLAATGSLADRLDLLEAVLAARLPEPGGVDPRIALALRCLEAAQPVRAAVAASGYSQRHFTQLFTSAVGLNPKTYSRLRRFGRTLDALSARPESAWSALALDHGYADQAHFTREFRAFAGMTPGAYRRAAPANARHVPV